MVTSHRKCFYRHRCICDLWCINTSITMVKYLS